MPESTTTDEGDRRPHNRFTDLVGCRLPIQLASMGAVVTPELAGSVAAAGGLGMLAVVGLSSEDVAHQIASATQWSGTGGRVGVGFLMPFLDMAAFETAASQAPLVECFYGDPDPALVRIAHDTGSLVSWQVGSADEALAAADAGCDLIVVQGTEAGGHIRGDQPLLALLGALRSRVELPLVGAGGIGNAEQALEAFEAGADAVRLGTRFLAAAEADVHPDYLGSLVSALADDTAITEAFSAGWPDAPHRVLKSCVDASTDDPSDRLPLPPTGAFVGDVESAALYAGRSVEAVTGPAPAAEIVAEFAAAIARSDGRATPNS